MSQSLAWWRAIVAAAIVLCIVLAVTASGQGGKAQGGYAVVDIQKLVADYKQRQVIAGELKAIEERYNARLQRRATYPDLTDQEQTTLDDFYDKGATASDAEKAKAKELEDKGKKLADDFRALSEKKDLTDADKAKLQEVGKVRQASQDRFTALQSELRDKLGEEQAKRQDLLAKRVREAVGKIAEQKGIAVVFSTEVALYAGTDITQQVVDELNKGK